MMLDEFKEPLFPEEKDFTRPTFERKTGEIGIFVDVYDAEPMDRNAFGSRQYFLMNLIDRFYNEVSQGELFKIKGFFHKRNLLQNITIEYFHPGILLVVNTNTKESLDNLVKSYDSGQLNEAFVECFVTQKVEKKIEVSNLKLKIKIFPDEISAVSSEWQLKYLPQPYLISQSDKDMRMIHIIKKFQQRVLFKKLNKLKDDQSKFENSSQEFLQYLKQYSNTNQEEIKNISDANKLCKHFSTNPDAQPKFYLFQKYFLLIGELQQIIRETETHVLFPLSQIRIGCENEGQREVNMKIQKKIEIIKSALKEKSPFKLFSTHMELMIPKLDRKIWAGMIYLIPASISILNDVDQQIDNYFQLGNFNQIIKEYEYKIKNNN